MFKNIVHQSLRVLKVSTSSRVASLPAASSIVSLGGNRSYSNVSINFENFPRFSSYLLLLFLIFGVWMKVFYVFWLIGKFQWNYLILEPCGFETADAIRSWVLSVDFERLHVKSETCVLKVISETCYKTVLILEQFTCFWRCLFKRELCWWYWWNFVLLFYDGC